MIPGWWSSALLGRDDPYDAWMPNVQCSSHCVPRNMKVKRAFRKHCEHSQDRFGVYYDLMADQIGKARWNTVFKLYAPIPAGCEPSKLLQDELVAVLETKHTRGSISWITEWKRTHPIRRVVNEPVRPWWRWWA